MILKASPRETAPPWTLAAAAACRALVAGTAPWAYRALAPPAAAAGAAGAFPPRAGRGARCDLLAFLSAVIWVGACIDGWRNGRGRFEAGGRGDEGDEGDCQFVRQAVRVLDKLDGTYELIERLVYVHAGHCVWVLGWKRGWEGVVVGWAEEGRAAGGPLRCFLLQRLRQSYAQATLELRPPSLPSETAEGRPPYGPFSSFLPQIPTNPRQSALTLLACSRRTSSLQLCQRDFCTKGDARLPSRGAPSRLSAPLLPRPAYLDTAPPTRLHPTAAQLTPLRLLPVLKPSL